MRLSRGNSGFQLRIMAIALLPTLMLAILLGAYMIHRRHNDLDTGLQQRGQLLLRQLAAAADYGLFSGNHQALQSLALAVAREPSVSGVVILDANAQPVASAGQEIRIAVTLDRVDAQQVVSHDLANHRQFVARVQPQSLVVDDFDSGPPRPAAAAGVVAVEMSLTSIREEQAGFAVVVSVLLGTVLLGTFFVARSMSARLSRPVLDVVDAVQRIGQGELGVRVRPTSIKVLNRLSQGFNDTAQRLERSREELENRVAQATAELLQKKEQAERADHSKTRFLAAASHDLRQPMHALSLFMSAIAQSTDEAERRHLVRQASSAATAMGNLLDALLDISKLDAGSMQASVGHFALQQVLDRLRETFTELADRKGLELTVRKSSAWVRSDPLLLERILGNFIANAIRYTPADRGSQGRVLVAVRRRGAVVEIEVRDNGVGIEAASQEAIFQEFVQLSNPERDRSKGLGLGLAIVKRLAGLLEHPIRVYSAPGRGSVFAVAVAQVEPGVAPAAEAPGDAAGGVLPMDAMRVLVVDDDALVRESITRLLQLWGCDVLDLSGDEPSLASLDPQAWTPHAILCDFRLAHSLNGLEVIARLRRLYGTPVAAAIVTGDTELPALRSLDGVGIRVLYKPVRPAQLRAVLKAMA